MTPSRPYPPPGPYVPRGPVDRFLWRHQRRLDKILDFFVGLIWPLPKDR